MHGQPLEASHLPLVVLWYAFLSLAVEVCHANNVVLLKERKVLEEIRRESLVEKLMETIMQFWKRTSLAC